MPEEINQINTNEQPPVAQMPIQKGMPEQTHHHTGTLGKFMFVFILGAIIFGLFLLFAGKTPYDLMNLKPSLENSMKQDETDEPEMVEEDLETVKKEDMNKDEAQITEEVMMEIDGLDTSDVSSNYNGSQLVDLE